VWQKNIKVYKVLGIISGAINIVYFAFIGSIFGIILESIVCLVTIAFTIIYILNERKEKVLKNNDLLESQKGEV
jgi:hypothetical protein